MNKIQDYIKHSLDESAKLKSQIDTDIIVEIAKEMINAIKNNNQIMFCGNGGSAADSQHLATELIHQFEKKRESYKAIALTTDTSCLTAIGNDWGFDQIFSRQVEGLGSSGDILIGISTSGNSSNIIKAFEVAKEKKIKCIGFLGKDGGQMKDIADIAFIVPHENTARIQEVHITVGHILCKLIEENV